MTPFISFSSSTGPVIGARMAIAGVWVAGVGARVAGIGARVDAMVVGIGVRDGARVEGISARVAGIGARVTGATVSWKEACSRDVCRYVSWGYCKSAMHSSDHAAASV